MAAPTPNAPAVQLSDDDIQRMRFRKAMARKKRKERESEGEIKELNITAMMDMMTIILVFLIKSYSASSVTVTSSEDVRPPTSTTRSTPKDTVAITVTAKSIMVGEKRKVEMAGGLLPASAMNGKLIVPLDEALKKEVEKLKYIAERNPGAPFNHEVSIIGDKRVPYETLSSVLYTAGQNELENFRFVVIAKEDGQ